MAKIPEPTNTIASLIDAAHAAKQEPPRPHLGASLLGHPCDRYLWLSFRWAVVQKFEGRMLRLFRRGHMEEDTILEDLRLIGCKINERQGSVTFNAHVSGSCDGIISSGVPEAPNKAHVLECKTHSRKSFDELIKKKVEAAKPQHYIQMQVYMYGLNIDRALYYAICKDSDRIYTERVRLDKELAKKHIDRGHKIALSDYMPEPISADPSWYQCKMCSCYEFCHETHITKELNCRTCAHSTAHENSTFTCARYEDAEIELQYQRTGCGAHVLHPDLVPWKRLPADTPHEALYLIDGVEVRNGEADTNVYSSAELLADPNACAHADDAVNELRTEFNAKIVVQDY